jgi:hypothetical protein
VNIKKITASLLTIATVAASPVTGSAQSGNQTKVAQCNRIIEIANEAVRDTKNMTSGEQASSVEAVLRVANAMDSAAAQLDNTSITDPRLQTFKSRFIRMYRQTSRAARNFATAFNNNNRPAAESALQALQAATSPEKQLVADINNYCQR